MQPQASLLLFVCIRIQAALEHLLVYIYRLVVMVLGECTEGIITFKLFLFSDSRLDNARCLVPLFKKNVAIFMNRNTIYTHSPNGKFGYNDNIVFLCWENLKFI